MYKVAEMPQHNSISGAKLMLHCSLVKKMGYFDKLSTGFSEQNLKFDDDIWYKGKATFEVLLAHKGSIKLRFPCSIQPKIA